MALKMGNVFRKDDFPRNRRRPSLWASRNVHFVGIASGSGGELETQLLLASSLEYLAEEDAAALLDLYGEVERMLQALMRSLEQRQAEKR
jgi:hypothetical protein